MAEKMNTKRTALISDLNIVKNYPTQFGGQYYWRRFNSYLNNHVGLMVFYIIVVKAINIILSCLK